MPTTTIKIDGTEAAAKLRAELQPTLQAAADLAETVAGALDRVDRINDVGPLHESLHGLEGQALIAKDDEAALRVALDIWREVSSELLGKYADEGTEGER